MLDIPYHISAVFIACVITCFGFLFYAVKVAAGTKEKSYAPMITIIGMIAWIGFHSVLSLSGYFQDTEAMPPLLFLFAGASILILVAVFATPRSRAFLARMPITTLTYVHIIRVPVEIVLWWLFLAKVVPESMTFEGSNYDILSGITAPFVALFLIGKKVNKIWAVLWNVAALGLLITIVFTAIGSSPYFIEPEAGVVVNRAIFYFPFTLLPLFVVPVVLLSHLISLYQLLFLKSED